MPFLLLLAVRRSRARRADFGLRRDVQLLGADALPALRPRAADVGVQPRTRCARTCTCCRTPPWRARPFLLAADKRVAFYAVRCALGAFSALCEARFARAVGAAFGRDVGATTLAFLLTAAGSSTRRSPSCRRRLRCTASCSTAAWVQPKPDYAGAIYGPRRRRCSAGPLRRPRRAARARRARHHRPPRLRPPERGGGGAAVMAALVDCGCTAASDRAAQHPAVQSLRRHRLRPQLYGVEAWHYLQNLALNLNASSPPRCSPCSSRCPTSTRRPATAAPPAAPPGACPQRRAPLARLFSAIPHKEERFMFPIYLGSPPLLSLSSAPAS